MTQDVNFFNQSNATTRSPDDNDDIGEDDNANWGEGCGESPLVTNKLSRKLVSTFSPLINPQVLSLVIEYDVNGNGKLDFDEFMEMMAG